MAGAGPNGGGRGGGVANDTRRGKPENPDAAPGSQLVLGNDNSRVTPQNPNATPGVHVFYAPENAATGEWRYQRLEEKAGMNSCVGVDIKGDHRVDVVCTGGGGITRWYENLGVAGASTSAR